MFKIKKGDQVIVLTGKYKKMTGVVLNILPKRDKAIVKNICIVKKHVKSNNHKGKILRKELPIHLSNLSIIDKGKPTRIGFQIKNGKKVRIMKKNKKRLL
jgi:large subunit ribosomal protein L24